MYLTLSYSDKIALMESLDSTIVNTYLPYLRFVVYIWQMKRGWYWSSCGGPINCVHERGRSSFSSMTKADTSDSDILHRDRLLN